MADEIGHFNAALKFLNEKSSDVVVPLGFWHGDTESQGFHLKNLLVIGIMENDDNPSNVDLNWVDFFVYIHDPPLGRLTKEMVEFIRNQIGRFGDVYLDKGGQLWVLLYVSESASMSTNHYEKS
ncbi:hypothetical protein Salat_1194800 [Sesamum alatum]|uniref:Uncharacterized protein n=1 Tax=Sesamum alatum TaxID=300844 RepID=A0AAE1YF67_9LAMI|nr:hypothetical protein Salat_1194800 [Sesamum alatum]